MKRSNNKTGLFLMELMISLLIFAVCACVCAAIIAKASADLSESRDMSNALILSQNKAELIKSGMIGENGTEYFSAELEPTDEENSIYTAVFSLNSNESGFTEYTVEIYRTADRKMLYNIDSAYYA